MKNIMFKDLLFYLCLDENTKNKSTHIYYQKTVHSHSQGHYFTHISTINSKMSIF